MKTALALGILGLVTLAGLLCVVVRWGDCSLADW